MGHTPGPWTVCENKRERTIQIDTTRGTVVQPGAISWIPDAALIAAAPDLLAALKEALGQHGHIPVDCVAWQDRARAAIKKAKGE